MNSFLNIFDNKLHNKMQNSFIDKFIHEIQENLEKKENQKILSTIPINSNLHFAKFDGNYAICFDYNSKKIYNIPKNYIINNTLHQIDEGDPIKVVSKNKFCIDSSGIPANPDNICNLLKECSYVSLSNKANILPTYYKIQDINQDFATCLIMNSNKKEYIPVDDLPNNAKNGDILVFKNHKFIIKNVSSKT